jgi:multimeric flavodoxin WrbA
MAGKVIGILGSPLTEGNTALLLDQALKGAGDAGCTVEKIVVASLDFQACQEMMFCKEHETCIMDDDMQDIYPKFRELEGLIVATPVMTMGIPGKLKSFIDRFQVFFMAKYMRKKPMIPDNKKNERKGLFICISRMSSSSMIWIRSAISGSGQTFLKQHTGRDLHWERAFWKINKYSLFPHPSQNQDQKSVILPVLFFRGIPAPAY